MKFSTTEESKLVTKEHDKYFHSNECNETQLSIFVPCVDLLQHVPALMQGAVISAIRYQIKNCESPYVHFAQTSQKYVIKGTFVL